MGKAKSYTKKQMLGKALMYIVLILGAIYTLIPFATIIITSFRTTKESVRGHFTWPLE